MSRIVDAPVATRVIGGDERRVFIEKTVLRKNHPGLKLVVISIPRIPTLHGHYGEAR